MAAREQKAELAALALLEVAMDLPSPERAAFIEAMDDAPAEVKARALALLASDSEAPVSLRTGGAPDLEPDIELPEQVGAYKILRALGRGGMGTVYLAERSSGDFEHQVAIKLIKPGVFSDSLIERFGRERQILAQLNHPHIAHLYDGGETGDGQPYIVMEYVEGQTLSEWIGGEIPDIVARLDMFLQITEAVEFAHQNLIIHRDLTPNNVLVNADGQAKLIDFGIARPQLEDVDPGKASTFTGLSLTPGFAAPERSNGAASNTLSDIYSLGKILALLVPGEDNAEITAIADKASHPDPAMRYATAGDLLDDIENYSEHRPVLAFSSAKRYRFRKFVSRQKLAVGSTAAVILLLAAGLGGTGWAYNQAETARADAQQRFDEVRSLAKFQIFDLYDQLDQVVGNTKARVALAKQAQGYLVRLSETPGASDELKLETARGFIKLARIQGVSAYVNFGEMELAKGNLDRAGELLTSLGKPADPEIAAALARRSAFKALILMHHEGEPEKAKIEIARALREIAKVPESKRNWSWMDARRTVRIAQLESGDLGMATTGMAEITELMAADIDEWPAGKRKQYEEQYDRAVIDNYKATALLNTGKRAQMKSALELYLQADRKFVAILEKNPNDPLSLYRQGWNAYYGHGAASEIDNMAQADHLLQQARNSVAQLLKIEENDNSLVVFAERLQEAQAELYANTGRFNEAIALQQGIVDGRIADAQRRGSLGGLSDLAFGYATLGTIARRASRRELACKSWQKAEKLMAEIDAKGDLQGYVADLRKGMLANIGRCKRGEAVGSFRRLSGG